MESFGINCVDPRTGKPYQVSVNAETIGEARLLAYRDGHTPDTDGLSMNPQLESRSEEFFVPGTNSSNGIAGVIIAVVAACIILIVGGLVWYVMRASPRLMPSP